jgi:hypothetical protein
VAIKTITCPATVVMTYRSLSDENTDLESPDTVLLVEAVDRPAWPRLPWPDLPPARGLRVRLRALTMSIAAKERLRFEIDFDINMIITYIYIYRQVIIVRD